jgi:hypothetical protein
VPIRVIIVGDHPHAGKTGTITGKVIKFPWGEEKWEVALPADDWSEGGCFASKKNLRRLPEVPTS